jgi:4'-phosphopantetheinyl transferase EntD
MVDRGTTLQGILRPASAFLRVDLTREDARFGSRMTVVSLCKHRPVRSVLPPDVEVVEGAVADHTASLFPTESQSVAHAVRSRRLQFSTGRAFAREALGNIGLTPTEIPPGPDREPQWPMGTIGSITHTRTYCAVGVSRADRYASIGVDVEIESEVDRALARLVATEHELTGLRQSGLSQEAALAIAFSAKEAFYKSQFPITRRMLGFHDVEIELEAGRGTFRVRDKTGSDGLPFNGDVEGRFTLCCGLIATALVLPSVD